MEAPFGYDSPYAYAFHSYAFEDATLYYTEIATSSHKVAVDNIYGGTIAPASDDGLPASDGDESAFGVFDPGSTISPTGQGPSPLHLQTQMPLINDISQQNSLSIDDYCFQAEESLLDHTSLTSAYFAYYAAADPPTGSPGEGSFSSSSSSVRSYRFPILTWY
jgi:hypothetical protein